MSDNDVLRASCAECPNTLIPDMNSNTWCTGGGDCEIKTFSKDIVVDDFGALVDIPEVHTCVSKYIFETPGFKKTLRSC